MIDNSRMKIYDFLYTMFYDVVSKNVYKMERPQELTQEDIESGFIVVRVGSVNDASEFVGSAYIWSRVYVEAYIPPKSRGRLDKNKYNALENSIEAVIRNWYDKVSDTGFSIDEDSLISTDDFLSTNKDNSFHVFVQSFVVYKNDDVDANYKGDLYIGLGDSQISDIDDVENLVNIQHFNTDEPSGDYMIAFPGTKYLWICTTEEIDKVLSSEIDVPMESPIMIESLYCYRSSNAILEGDMFFTII